jgi:hypothetical protein
MNVDIYHPRVYGTGAVTRIAPSGLYFVDSTGQLVIRKSLTAFCAPKRYAEGRGNEVLAYMGWAVSKGFNEIRVFSQVDWTGPPGAGVESGWHYDEANMELLLADAADHGLRVEVVAHTYPYYLDGMVAHLQRVDELCMRHENALLEVTNEPQGNGGNDLSKQILARYTPHTPGWSSGVYDPIPYPAGQSMTHHSPRDNEWPRKFKDAYEFSTGAGPTQPFSPGYKGPVMLDEPPRVEETASPDDWRAYGAGAAFFAAGATMHGMPDFQKCVIPSRADVLACVASFIAGFNDVPLQRYTGYEHPADNGSLRRYRRRGEDGKTYEISVRPYEFKQV